MAEGVEAAAATPDVSRTTALATDVLQGLLIGCVVGWVLDVPRRTLGLAFYTEQLLAVCMGLALALCFISSSNRRPSPIDWGAAMASFGIAAYIAYRLNTSAPVPPGLIACLAATLVWTVIGSRAWAMRWFDWFAAALSIVICLYITVRYEPLTYEIALLPLEGIIGSAILVLLVLEATRRTAGATLVAIILLLIVYVFIGPHLPGDFATRPVTPERLLVYFGLDVNGMIGPLLGVAILIVVPFTLMGQVLGRTGGAAYFADIAMSGMGAFRGGAAKIAVVGSALFGMISGAAVSNVVAVGIVTIPLMARSGFSRTRAAAIESVGSTGGQLMPPVMGAAAFIMAEFLQVSYGAVCIAALIPSVLYYAALFLHVDLEAGKQKIGAAQVENIPSFLEVIKSGWHFPIPIAFLIITIAYPEVFQIPIERAAVYSTGILIVLCLMFGYRGSKVGVRQIVRAVLDTGRAALDIVLIGAAAGMVVGALNISGISFGLTLQLIAISGESLIVLLLLTAVISIILGMGMPTISVYVLTATLLAPSLVKLGVTPMAAHMYVMYFGMLSMITPPVAIAAYAAANIARVSGWTTGWTAMVVGWSTFFIPFLFVLEPSLLMDGPAWLIAWNFVRNVLGIYVGTAAIVGFAFTVLSLPLRIAMAISAVTILVPPNAFPGAGMLDWIGLAAAVIIVGFDFARSRIARKLVAATAAER
jgi:TRAP transporter 4TM/12TM fusion protein